MTPKERIEELERERMRVREKLFEIQKELNKLLFEEPKDLEPYRPGL
jgi:hypothetical protein